MAFNADYTIKINKVFGLFFIFLMAASAVASLFIKEQIPNLLSLVASLLLGLIGVGHITAAQIMTYIREVTKDEEEN